jgi:hypothetical protein
MQEWKKWSLAARGILPQGGGLKPLAIAANNC